MAFSRTVLYFGQLASAKADVFTPTSGSNAYAHLITLHNTNSSTETVELFYNDGTNEYQFLDIDLTTGETVFLQIPNEGFTVKDGGKITGNTTTALMVTIKIDGSEES